MVINVKFKNAYYRRYRQDIWGVVQYTIHCRKPKLIRKQSWFKKYEPTPFGLKRCFIVKFFYAIYRRKMDLFIESKKRYIYRVVKKPRVVIPKKMKPRFVSVRLTRIYFISLKDHQFRRILKRCAFLDGNMEDHYLYALEGRLLNVVYRCNYFHNFYEAMDVIKKGFFTVDRKVVTSINYKVPLFTFLRLDRDWIPFMKAMLKHRAKDCSFLFPTPKYIYISYVFFFSYLISLPKKDQLVYPFDIDIYRLTGYF